MTSKEHPLRLARVRAGLPRMDLARRAGVPRSTVISIEKGVTREPGLETLAKLAPHLGVNPTTLSRDIAEWVAQSTPRWTPPQRALLGTPIPITRATSFLQWRTRLEPSRSKFAAQLGVALPTLRKYELGERRLGMPDTIIAGLARIGLTDEQIGDLAALPPCPPSMRRLPQATENREGE